MIKLHYKQILLIVLSVVLLGCSESETKKNNTVKKDTIQKRVLDSIFISNKIKENGTIFKVPTPFEFYEYFKKAGGSYQASLVQNTNDISKYLTSKEKAIAFGMYASDLAYSAVFGQNQRTITYFDANKNIAEQLGILEGFNNKLLERFNKNLDNVDSLYQLTTGSYWDVFKYLEDQDKTKILSYVIVSGWIESLYIAYNSVDHHSNNELISCLSDQLYVIENLNSYIQTIHGIDINNDNVLIMASNLYQEYQELYTNTDSIYMTEKQFDNIKAIVNKQHKQLTK